jgi:mannose-1-phosphate guanylyltransferase
MSRQEHLPSMTNAMILCAGLGTRLRPLTDELPKPLVWLGDAPLVAHVVERLAQGGVRRVVINTHHLASAFHDGRLAGLPLEVGFVHEPRILGTAGGLAGAAAVVGEGDVLVWNGDILADVDVGGLLEAHRLSGALATLAVAPRHPDEARVSEGTVGLGADGAVVRLRGERFGVEVRGADFLGVHVVGARLRVDLPAEGCLVGDVYLPALRAGGKLASFAVPGGFRDLGTVDAYLDENRRWLRLTHRSAYVGEGATVDTEVEVVGSVVGARASVRGRGVLRDVVVWPGAVACAPLEGAVVMTDGRIVRPSRG